MNLLVFCDGTWNTPQQLDDGKPAPTNVVKLRNAVAENTQQRVYYHSGVGTEGGVIAILAVASAKVLIRILSAPITGWRPAISPAIKYGCLALAAELIPSGVLAG